MSIKEEFKFQGEEVKKAFLDGVQVGQQKMIKEFKEMIERKIFFYKSLKYLNKGYAKARIVLNELEELKSQVSNHSQQIKDGNLTIPRENIPSISQGSADSQVEKGEKLCQ